MGFKERFTSRPMIKKLILSKSVNGNICEISRECYDIIDNLLGSFLDEIVTKAVQNMVETKGKRLDRRDIEAAIGMEIADLPSRKKLRKKDQTKIIPPEMPVEKEEAAMDNENSDLVINPTKQTDVPIELPIASTDININGGN